MLKLVELVLEEIWSSPSLSKFGWVGYNQIGRVSIGWHRPT